MMSWRSSRGSISVMERASIDFPVPGSPINITCRFCSEALDHFDGVFLPDDLVNEPLRNLDFCSGPEVDLANPRIHGREFFGFSRSLHHLQTVPSQGSI